MNPSFDRESKIVLFFAYYKISGVPVQLARFARFLVEQTNRQVVVIDYVDGALNKLTQDLSVERRMFNSGVDVRIHSEEVLLTQATPFEYLRPEIIFDPGSKILFWHLHPDNMKLNQIGFFNFKGRMRFLRPLQFNRLKNQLNVLRSANGLVFMDEFNRNSVNHFYGLSFREIYSPIMSGQYCEKDQKNNAKELTRNIAYYGRIESFKTPAILRLIEELSLIQKQQNIQYQFILIGYGEDRNKVENHARNLNVLITSLGVIEPCDIGRTLRDYSISVVFAMGTSILDVMRTYTVVVKLNYFQSNFKGYPIYTLKTKDNSYCLARELQKGEFSTQSTLIPLFDEIRRNYLSILSEQRAYLSNYYDDNKNAKILLNNLESTTLSGEALTKLIFRTFLRKAYNHLKYGVFR